MATPSDSSHEAVFRAKLYIESNFNRKLSLDQIAEQTGFANEFHLSRDFKTWAGMTASAFRRD
jgi:AraC-like DNA-binding protein